MDSAFRAAAESVEEALLNALCTADRVTGNNGRNIVTVPGLSEVLPAILEAMSADRTDHPKDRPAGGDGY
jgi:L-aminopeptidase/D-esterase-like protein